MPKHSGDQRNLHDTILQRIINRVFQQYYQDKGRGGNQVLGLEKPINAGFRDEVSIRLRVPYRHFPGRELRSLQCQFQGSVTAFIQDPVPDPPTLWPAVFSSQVGEAVPLQPQCDQFRGIAFVCTDDFLDSSAVGLRSTFPGTGNHDLPIFGCDALYTGHSSDGLEDK